MKEFAALVKLLGITTKTNDKLSALSHYFSVAPGPDKVWVIALFSGRKPRRMINTTILTNWCIELISIEKWLFEECYHTVGDLAETFALLLPENNQAANNQNSLSMYMQRLMDLIGEGEAHKKQFIISAWTSMSRDEIFVFNKLLTSSFRIGVSQKIIVNALAASTGLAASVIAHRITGHWDPSAISFEELLNSETVDESKPYPFFLAHALEADPDTLGAPEDWQAEWKWDGIRGQLIKRNGHLFIWSRGEELMTDKFPEYDALRDLLPDGIALDGEILPSANGLPLPFALLQTRIGRKTVTKNNWSTHR